MSRGRRLLLAGPRSLLTAGAVVGVVCIIALGTCLALGARPVVVMSGSMSPAIPAGSLVFTRGADAADVEVGDVVIVEAGGTRVMHRVVDSVPAGQETVLTLKGDANATPDAEPYLVRRVGLVRLHLPLLGYPVSWLSTLKGLLVLGGAACALLVFAFRRSAVPQPGGRRRALVRLAVPAIAVAVMGAAQPAGAWFTDTGTVTSGAASTHTVTSQAQPSCANVDGLLVLGNIARITWQQVDSKYEYVWQLQNTSGGVVASGTVGTGLSAGQTVTLDISTGLIGTNANYNVVVHARLASAPSWVAASTTTKVHRVSILIIGAAMRCGWG